MFSSLLQPLVVVLALARLSAAASTISIFTDAECNASLRSVSGPNGFPNGTCTDLRRNGPYGSFHVIELDAGCTVTIYKKDTTADPCSGAAEIAAPLECYDSTYVYYSIDFCDPGAVHSALPTPTPTPSPTPAPASRPNTAAIAGGVVGGVVGLALLAGAAFWVWRRRKRASPRVEADGDDAREPHTPVGELHAHERSEMGVGKVVYRREAAEVAVPAVEIGGTEVGWRERPEGKS